MWDIVVPFVSQQGKQFGKVWPFGSHRCDIHDRTVSVIVLCSSGWNGARCFLYMTCQCQSGLRVTDARMDTEPHFHLVFTGNLDPWSDIKTHWNSGCKYTHYTCKNWWRRSFIIRPQLSVDATCTGDSPPLSLHASFKQAWLNPHMSPFLSRGK